MDIRDPNLVEDLALNVRGGVMLLRILNGKEKRVDFEKDEGLLSLVLNRKEEEDVEETWNVNTFDKMVVKMLSVTDYVLENVKEDLIKIEKDYNSNPNEENEVDFIGVKGVFSDFLKIKEILNGVYKDLFSE